MYIDMCVLYMNIHVYTVYIDYTYIDTFYTSYTHIYRNTHTHVYIYIHTYTFKLVGGQEEKEN